MQWQETEKGRKRGREGEKEKGRGLVGMEEQPLKKEKYKERLASRKTNPKKEIDQGKFQDNSCVADSKNRYCRLDIQKR